MRRDQGCGKTTAQQEATAVTSLARQNHRCRSARSQTCLHSRSTLEENHMEKLQVSLRRCAGVGLCGLQPRAHLNSSVCPFKTWGPSVSDGPHWLLLHAAAKLDCAHLAHACLLGHPIISMNILNTKNSVSFCFPVNQLLSGKFWILCVWLQIHRCASTHALIPTLWEEQARTASSRGGASVNFISCQ